MDYVPKVQKTDETEALFESTYTRTKETFQELYSYLFFKSPVRIVTAVILAVTELVMLISGGVLWYLTGEFPFYIVFFAVFSILYIVITRCWGYSNMLKVALARDRESCPNGPPCITFTATENTICSTGVHNGEKMELSFEHIKKVIATEHYLLLLTKAQMIHLVAKNGFTRGTYDGFCAYLRSKNFKVKTK